MSDLPPGFTTLDEYIAKVKARMSVWERIRYEWTRVKVRVRVWRYKRAARGEGA